MINPKSVNIYGFVSIGLMTLMLVLIWTGMVPRSMYMPLFLVAAALFMVRITLRLVLARQERAMKRQFEKKESEELPAKDHD